MGSKGVTPHYPAKLLLRYMARGRSVVGCASAHVDFLRQKKKITKEKPVRPCGPARIKGNRPKEAKPYLPAPLLRINIPTTPKPRIPNDAGSGTWTTRNPL